MKAVNEIKSIQINSINNLFTYRLSAVKYILSKLNELKDEIMKEVNTLLSETGFSGIVAVIPKIIPIDYYNVASLDGNKVVNKVVLVLSFRIRYFFDFKELEREDPNFAKQVKTNLIHVKKKISEIMHKHGLKYCTKFGYYIAYEAYYTY